MNSFSTNMAHAFRRTALPLVAYYVVTLALPLANGASASGAAFVRHALVVLAVPPILVVVGCGLWVAANSAGGMFNGYLSSLLLLVRLLTAQSTPRRNRRSVTARRSP